MFQIPNNRAIYLIYGCSMAVLAMLTFANLTTHQFENDDHGYLALMAAASQDASLLFDVDRQVAMRPPVDLLAFVSYLAWKDDPAPYHILLVVMQVSVSFLLAFTFYRLGAKLEISLLGGLLFLMNVSHFRVVQWITCRSYILTLIFGLLVLVQFYSYLRQNRQKNLIYAILFLILSIFTHPATFTFALFCTYLAWRQYGSVRSALSRSWTLLIVAPVCVVAASAISMQSDQVRGIQIFFDPIQMLSYLLWYASRLLTNAHWILAPFQDTPAPWELGVGFLVCLGVLYLSFRKSVPEADWGVWLLLTMLPFIYVPHMLPTGPSRHVYFSSAGSSLILASIIFKAANYISLRNPLQGRALFVFLVLGLVGSSFMSLKRSEAIAFYATGRSYISIGNLQEGISQLQKAYEHDASIVPFDGYLRLATASFASGKPQTDIFEEGLRHHPEHPQLLLLKGMSLLFSDDSERISEGRSNIRQAFENAEDKSALRSDAGLAFQNLAGYYHATEQYEKAVDFYKEAVIYRPHYAVAQFNLANALYKLGRTEEAIATMLQSVANDPDNRNAAQFLGNMLFEQKRYAESEAIYNQALARDPKNPNLYHNFAQALQRQGKLTEAAHAFRAGIALAPNDLDLRAKLAVALREQGDAEGAIGEYETILEQQPLNADALEQVTALLIAAERAQEAAQWIQKALELDSTRAQIWYLLAHAQQATGNTGGLQTALKNAVQRDPANPVYREAYLNLGSVLQQQGNMDAARAIYGDLTTYAPDLPEVYINLGILHFTRGDFAAAIDNFTRATQLSPNDAEAHLGLAQALVKTGRKREAGLAYERALTLDPGNPTAQMGLRDLKK